jgi:protein-S-isoprenylcysteine O-methyltransferase Ste14
MLLIERLTHHGGFLFRWRSFLPLILIPAAVPALFDGALVELGWGERLKDVWDLACLLISVVGLVLRWATVAFVPAGTSGRNTHAQRADILNTTGLYSVVRNPLYLGNFLALLGLALTVKVWWFVLLVALAYWLYIERIVVAEEAFLTKKFGAAYLSWAARTPAFLPNPTLWRAPAHAFSLRTLLRREYNGLLALATAYLALELVTDIAIEHQPVRLWLAHEGGRTILVFAAALFAFLVLRTLKKRTRLLRVEGR